ncbi:MAG: hypothetical protein N4A45_03860 [Flavobacteriales bacterium]|jgi:hypothetical protein|nr:hypothetical protein [Flavobacteriales bacterium]
MSFKSFVQKEKFYLGVAAIIALVYYVFSTYSKGYYQHDEAAHFLNMQQFWVEPSSILSTWSKPGFKIAYIIPALFGAKAVLWTNILFASATAFISGKIIEHFKIPYRTLGMVITAFIPMLYQIAFRNYSEIITGLVLSIIVLAYVKKKYWAVALLAGYLFTLRQEMVLASGFIGLMFIIRKQWLPIIGFFIAPLLLNFFGWLHSGNPLFLWDQLTGGGLDHYKEFGFFHLWKMFTPSVGVISTALFLLGFLGFVYAKEGIKSFFEKYHILYIALVPVFIFMCLVTEPAFTLFKLSANLRQIVLFAPIIGVFGALGYQYLAEKINPKISLIILGIYGLLVVTMLSYEYNHVAFTDVVDNSKMAMFFIGMGLILIVSHLGIMDLKKLSWVVAILIIGHTIQQEKPYKLNEEEISVQKAVKFFERNKLAKEKPIFSNHNMFMYFNGSTAQERKDHYISGMYTPQKMDELPVGTIFVWDSHYTHRPNNKEHKGIPIQYFQNNDKYQMLFQNLSKNKRFYIAILKKVR